jgi:hypothetical protein
VQSAGKWVAKGRRRDAPRGFILFNNVEPDNLNGLDHCTIVNRPTLVDRTVYWSHTIFSSTSSQVYFFCSPRWNRERLEVLYG